MKRDTSGIQSIEGIILRRFPVGENDQIYVIYTREFGKIRGSAKGALNPKNRWRGVLEPFYLVEAQLFMPRSGGLNRFSSADVLSRPKGFLNDLTALHSAYLILECLSSFVADETPDEILFNAVLATLGAVNDSPQYAGFHVRSFCLFFISHSGFGSEWSCCVCCGKKRPVDRSGYFLTSRGGIFCRSCIPDPDKSPDRILKHQTLELARVVSEGVMINPASLDESSMRCFNEEIMRVLKEAFAYHMGEIPKSMNLLI